MKRNRTVTIDDEVWEMVQRVADAKFTSKSDIIQRLIIKEHEKEFQNEKQD